MWLMNRQWLRQIYLNCFYIPELIQLANDVETNLGPGIVDPTKTIAAPYSQQSQGNVKVFGTANAGTQCMAMFLYCMPNGRYKVFDSHRRDLLGMGHPLGTFTLIEIDSFMNLMQHFRIMYAQTSNTYEIEGVNIIQMQSSSISIVHSLYV